MPCFSISLYRVMRDMESLVQHGYSSSNHVALVGYTIIPALLTRDTPDVSLTVRLPMTF